EIEQLQGLLKQTSLLTLTGSGGCGKTRLVLRLAQSVREEVSDGVWFVELGALTDPALVPTAAMAAMGLREQPGQPIVQTVLQHLATRKIMLVLDGCEHLLDACARFVGAILQTGSDDKVI